MDLLFSDDHQCFRERVRQFAERQLAPHSRRWDEENRLPWEGIRSMANEGLFGLIAPKALGGQQQDYVSLGIAIEEIARADVSCAIICWLQATLGTLIPGWDDETLREVHAGNRLICLATSEEDAGSDMSNIQTMAMLDGGEYIVNGEKVHVSLIPGAQVLGVSARVLAGDDKPKVSMFQISADAPGVTCSPMEQMGARAHQLGRVQLSNVRVPASALMGEQGAGRKMMKARFNVSRCLSPLAAIGAAQSALDLTATFAKSRIVFGRPIATNQSISFPLVEHTTRLEAARLLSYKALWENQTGQDATRDAAMAKWFGISSAIDALSDCLKIHGANGYLKDNLIEQKLRDGIAFSFTGGTVNVMKLLLVRELLGREFAGLA